MAVALPFAILYELSAAASESFRSDAKIISREMTKRLEQDWLHGRASLGAAAGWTAEEMRVVADLGFALAEQGRDDEALTIFEGLAALAPATAYFQAALGALCLRRGDPARAREHLDLALAGDDKLVTALVNRGEALMQMQDFNSAAADLRRALEIDAGSDATGVTALALRRARALLAVLRERADAPG